MHHTIQRVPVPAALARHLADITRHGTLVNRNAVSAELSLMRAEAAEKTWLTRNIASAERLLDALDAHDRFYPTFHMAAKSHTVISSVQLPEWGDAWLGTPAGHTLCRLDVTEPVWSTYATLSGDQLLAQVTAGMGDVYFKTMQLAAATGSLLPVVRSRPAMKRALLNYFFPREDTTHAPGEFVELLSALFPAAVAYRNAFVPVHTGSEYISRVANDAAVSRLLPLLDRARETGAVPMAWIGHGDVWLSGERSDLADIAACLDISSSAGI